jgi:hypothetical protein
MKKAIKIIAISMLIAISACVKPMMNDQIISETKKCEQAGLHPQTLVNRDTAEVIRVQCIPSYTCKKD